MKKIIIPLIATLFTTGCMAQLMPHPQGSYTLSPSLDKFVGTWKWVSGNDTMVLTFLKQKAHFRSPLNYDVDVLVGWHSYIKNGTLVESSLQYAGATPFSWSGQFTLLGSADADYKVGFTTFKDITKHKTSSNLTFTINKFNINQATWVLKNSQGMKNANYDYGFTVPLNMVFTRQ